MNLEKFKYANGMKVAVYGTTYDRAIQFMHRIKNEIGDEQLKRSIFRKDYGEIEMLNGNIFKTYKIQQNTRGMKYNYAFIDFEITREGLFELVYYSYIPIQNGENNHVKFEDAIEFYI